MTWLLLVFLVPIPVDLFLWATHRQTLSESVWKIIRVRPWTWLLPLLVGVTMVLLFAHFFLGLWR
jgi:hypothetical protein